MLGYFQNTDSRLVALLLKSTLVFITSFMALGSSTTPLWAQQLADHPPEATEATTVVKRPPLPSVTPRLAPERTTPQITQITGITGVAYGQSKIGTGEEVMRFGEDIDKRTTTISLDLIADSPNFQMPDVTRNERWVRIDLGNQQVVAYEGRNPVNAFVISSGMRGTPTVTGEFRVRMKVSTQTMSGDGYNLPNVRWVMYFYQDYALHGSYWHNNFGNPMSHGCVNMTNADAKWIFDWSSPKWDGETVWYRPTKDDPGMLVIVHE